MASSPVAAQGAGNDVSVAATAFLAGHQGDWIGARQIAAGAADPVVGKLVVWMDATRQDGGGSFSELGGFVIDNPEWPLLRSVRQRAEQGLDDGTPDDALLAWFSRYPPLTLPGALRYARALRAAGDEAKARQVARTAWVEVDAQTVEDEDAFYVAFIDVLTADDHLRRFGRLLWAGRTTPAQRLLPRLDPAGRALAEARLALRAGSDDGPRRAALVPAELQDDPGLVYDQVRWHRRQGSAAEAGLLLTRYPVDRAQPEAFWKERQALARSSLSDGDAGTGYRIAAEHGYQRGSEFADSEWLAGWIALRFLNQPDAAQRHFMAMFENVQHSVSRARGAYWQGRAAEAMQDELGAALWHHAAAQHGVAFYGQLSAAEVRPGLPLILPPDPPASDAELGRFRDHELVRALRLLAATGEREPQRAFAVRLAELSESPGWKDQAAALAHEIGRPDLAVVVARQSVRNGQPLVRNGYPIIPVADAGGAVEAPLVFAIVRQESAFDQLAVSPAGAQGLMQLMPATARSVSGRLGLPYSPGGLTLDPGYNMQLGSAYIAGLLDRYDGSMVLALAAYNAGPGRVSEWLGRNGDPRVSEDAAVDWIELIPFSETRNYVQRCLENLQVYRARLGVQQLAQTGAPVLR